MKKGKNTRSLDGIADSIHKRGRNSIIEDGDDLLEAKDQCEHGQWLNWLESEFEWSEDTAHNRMKVARLAAKFRNLRNLKLGKLTLYALANHQPEEELPTIIKELAKHATKTHLRPLEADRVIKIGVGRHRFGDHPQATLAELGNLATAATGIGIKKRSMSFLRSSQTLTNRPRQSLTTP